MNNFALRPLQRGYTPEVANNLLEQQLMGGFARQRVQFVNNTHTITASMFLDDPRKQQYFWAFWRSHQENPRPFLWRLRIDGTEATDYQCQFVAGSLQLQERIGTSYAVSFGLRIKPKPSNQEFDQIIIDLWDKGDPKEYLNLLAKLVNEDLPDALGSL